MATFPETHRRFLDRAVAKLQEDARLVGVAMAGSYVSGQLDEWSDLDIVIIARDDANEQVLRDRTVIAEQLGDVVAAFTGEHVGEHRLLICLYDEPPLLHVDLKFLTLDGLRTKRIEDPIVLWERDGRVAQTIRETPATYPPIDYQWMEDRFWIWMHYSAVKLGRGEWFELIEGLSFLRFTVLAPMAKQLAGHEPRGVRWLERQIPQQLAALCETIARRHDPREIARALDATIAMYITLRNAALAQGAKLKINARAEELCRQFLRDVVERVASGGDSR